MIPKKTHLPCRVKAEDSEEDNTIYPLPIIVFVDDVPNIFTDDTGLIFTDGTEQ